MIFDDAMRRIRRKVSKVSGADRVPLTELLTNEFMVLGTDFRSVEEMFDAAGLSAVPEGELLSELQSERFRAL